MRSHRASMGLTIIELAVAVGILSLIITGTGYIFKQTAQATSLTQASMERNANIRAASLQLRDDLQGISRDGFLCILDGKKAGNDDTLVAPPILMFTATGSFQSRSDPSKNANAAIISYQPMKNRAESGQVTVLGRSVRLMVGVAPDEGDRTPKFLGEARGWGMVFAQLVDTKILTDERGTAAFQYVDSAPESLGEIEDLWPYMIGGCKGMEITFCDGMARGDYRVPTASGVTAEWLTAKDASTRKNWPAGVHTWLDDVPLSSYDVHAVMWTAGDRDAWPRAIRVAMTLQDVGQRAEPQRHEFVVSFP